MAQQGDQTNSFNSDVIKLSAEKNEEYKPEIKSNADKIQLDTDEIKSGAELEKVNSQISKSDVIQLLAEQKQELQTSISKLEISLSASTDSAIRSLGKELKACISAYQSQNDFFKLIEEMKKHEESRNLMFQVDMSEFHEQTERIKRLDSDTSKIIEIIASQPDIKSYKVEIQPDTVEMRSDAVIKEHKPEAEQNELFKKEFKEEIKEEFKEIKSILDTIVNKPEKSEIDLPSNLPPCPPASKLYKRADEDEIFEEIPKHKLSCIAGMAGVGKSTLAITYGHHRKENHQAKVFYFGAETAVKVAEDYKSFAKEIEVEHEQEDVRIRKVNNKLTKLAKTNEIIFIFDNVEDYSFIEKYICNRLGGICVLTTARNKDTISDDRVLSIQLEPFSRDEAINYVIQVLSENKIKREDIEELVEIVGDKNEVIPFNLNKVVSILSQPFLGKYKKTRLENIKNDPKLWIQTKFYDDFMTNETIKKILQFIPYFDPDSIDIRLLALMIGCDSEDSSLEEALVELLKNLLIKQDENGDQISVHRLLQKDLSEYFKKSENKSETRKTFIKIIDEKLRDAYNSIKNWSDVYNTHKHAISLVNRKIIENDKEKDNQINEIKAKIFSKLGAYYHLVKYKYILALEYTQKALEMTERLFQGDHQNKASSYTNIGRIYKDMGDLHKSLSYSTKALEMRERLFQGDHRDKASSYNNIGLIYKDMGDLKNSLEYSIKALEIRERLFPGDHQDKAKSNNNIGIIFHEMGDLNKSLEYSIKALEMTERLFPGDHQDKASSYNNIGLIYKYMGDLNKSLEYSTKALEIQERLFPEDHQDKASSYTNIGRIYKDMGDLHKSLEYSIKALEMTERLFPGDHRDKASSYKNIEKPKHLINDRSIGSIVTF